MLRAQHVAINRSQVSPELFRTFPKFFELAFPTPEALFVL